MGDAQARARLPDRQRHGVRHHLGLAHGEPEDGGDGPHRLPRDHRREPGPGAVPRHPGRGRPGGLADDYDVSREAQDRFALHSHEKAVAAQDGKRFRDEIVPVAVKGKKGAETVVEADEGPRRDTTMEKLSKLRPAFSEGGSVTAGNSSTLNDGAAAVLVVSKGYAEAHGLTPLAKIRSVAVAGVPPRVMGIGPVPATKKALDRAGITMEDVGLVELNEAFAAQSLAVIHEWGMAYDDGRLNPNGGAIALGHPLGASGARILTTLVHEMKRRPDVRYGLATMCIGVGQGIAMVVENAA
nr:thiolase family protein [Rubrobacter marinus]